MTGDAHANDQDLQDPYVRADQLYQDIINARTFSEIQAAIDDAAPVDYDANPQLIRAQVHPRQERLVIDPEGSGGLLTETEFELARFCTEEKLKKRASGRLIHMIKRRAFIVEDLHTESMREIERMISDSCASKISEFDLWKEIDGKQKVNVI